MLDAYAGFSETENDRVKVLASLIRSATLKIWNTQIIEKDRITDETEFWIFPWEKKNDDAKEKKDTSELEKNADAQAEYLLKHFPDGNSNNKS